MDMSWRIPPFLPNLRNMTLRSVLCSPQSSPVGLSHCFPIYPILASFPSLSYFSTPWRELPGTTSEINCLPSVSCFGETQLKRMMQSMAVIDR